MQLQTNPFNKISSLVLNNPVKRQRLFALLNCCDGGNAWWVSGPGGAGKSTLLASYFAESGSRAIWYRVDALDNDPATSFFYLRMAADNLLPDTDLHLPLLTPEYLPNLEVFLLKFFEHLYQGLPPGTWLVFDNVQDAPERSLIPQVLIAAVQQLPPACRLAVISRDEPFPAMSRFLANRLVVPLGWNSLAFTVAEFTELLEREKIPGGMRLAEHLHQLTGGWIAGAVLMMMQMKQGPLPGKRLPLASPEHVFSYFGGEVLEKIDGNSRNFLLETSQLPIMTADLVQEATGIAETSLLEELRQKNFFIEKRLFDTDTYQYHPLFHGFLSTTAERLFSRQRLLDLRRRTAQALERRGYVEEAVQLYAQTEDYDAICSIILQQAKTLVSEGRYRTLSAWLHALPPAMEVETPSLVYWRGVASIIDSPLESRQLCARAYHLFKAKSDLTGQLLSWSTMVEGFIMMRAGFAELDYWIAEGERLGENFAAIDNREAAALLSANMLIALLLRNQGHPDLPLWQERCESLLDGCSSLQVMAILVSGLFWSYHYLGEVKKAGLIETRLNMVVDQPGIPAMGRLMVNTLLALAAVGRGDHERCLAMIGRTLDLAEHTGIHAYDLMVIGFGVYTGLATGDLRLARHYLEMMPPLMAPHALWDHAQHHFLLAWYCTEKGDLAEAQHLLHKAADFIESCGNPYTVACVDILQANLQLDYGHTGTARQCLKKVENSKLLSHNKIMRMVTRLALADCAFADDDPDMGAHSFRKALDMIRQHGLTLPFPMINRRLGRVVAQALDAGIADPVVYDLVNRWKLRPPSPEMVGRQWPWPVKLFTFGGLEMVENENPLLTSSKPPRKLFELLLLLIAAKQPGIPKDQAAYRLWPDSDGDQGMQSLNTTLHRLRKLLSDDDAILVDNGRLLLNPRKCWVDCWRFEWLEQKAFSTGDHEAAGRFLLEGLKLYRGEFVPEHTSLAVAAGYAESLSRSRQNMITTAKALLEDGKLSSERADALRGALTGTKHYAMNVDQW